MEDEIIELKEEIKILNEKVNLLEKSNRRRKSYVYIKAIVKICLILVSIYGVWRGYEYVVNEVPKIIESKFNEINGDKS